MDDIEDIFEAVIDIEDIAEEIFEPEELVEDFIEDPLEIAIAGIALIGGLLTLLLLFGTLIVLLFTAGPMAVLGILTLLALIVTLLAVGAFVYYRTNVPRHVEKKINEAVEQADENTRKNESMTEQEAIEELKQQYTDGRIDEQELERSIDEVLKHDRKPKRIIKERN